MKLRAERVGGETLRSAALVFDEDIDDPGEGTIIAFVVYSDGGHIVYWHRRGNYDVLEVLVAGETFLGETLISERVKQYDAQVVPVGDPS